MKNSIEIKETQPAFYQHVTQELFTKIIEKAFPVIPSTSSSTCKLGSFSGRSLNYVEQNAVRHVAGYTCRKLWENFFLLSEIKI